MKFDIYPLQFDPILKDRIWGGKKLNTELNKPITSDITGESWEISTVEGDVSVISKGTFKGIYLNEFFSLQRAFRLEPTWQSCTLPMQT